VIKRGDSRHCRSPSGRSVRNFRYLVSSFVRHLQETRSATLGYLETNCKGHMLAMRSSCPILVTLQGSSVILRFTSTRRSC
jgi:hypothetical protein